MHKFVAQIIEIYCSLFNIPINNSSFAIEMIFNIMRVIMKEANASTLRIECRFIVP